MSSNLASRVIENTGFFGKAGAQSGRSGTPWEHEAVNKKGKNAMRTALSVLLCLVLAVPALAAAPQFTAAVVAVADGDTIIVLTREKQQVKIRLYGIDCPEGGQAFGRRAREATAKAVFNQTVTVQPMDTDSYGRTVAVVIMPDGKSLNEHLVREGLAWVYPQHCIQEDICAPLRDLEKSIRASKRGLWVDKAPVPPWEWRKLVKAPE